MLYRSHLTIFSIDNQHEKGSKKNAMEWSTTAYFPLQELHTIKKVFALSIWNIGNDYKNVSTEKEMLRLANDPITGGKYFVLNTSLKDLYTPVLQDQTYFNLLNDAKSLANKQIIMIDEHEKNSQLAAKMKESNKSYFDYSVWQTDHVFTNKRASLINKVLAFLEK